LVFRVLKGGRGAVRVADWCGLGLILACSVGCFGGAVGVFRIRNTNAVIFEVVFLLLPLVGLGRTENGVQD
jgi:hypothetical protein